MRFQIDKSYTKLSRETLVPVIAFRDPTESLFAAMLRALPKIFK